MDLQELGERYGWGTGLVALGKRLRCSCGERVALSVRTKRTMDYR